MDTITLTKSAKEFNPDLNWALDRPDPYRAPWDWMRLPIDDGTGDDPGPVTRGDTLVLEQPSGRSIWLVSLHQYATYGGLRAGLPRATDSYVDVALKTAQRIFSPGEPGAALLEPRLVRRQQVRVELPGKPVARLPLVTSVGLFDSQPVTDERLYRSSAVVVWFQERFGAPSERHIHAQLQALDWAKHASDWAL